MTHHAHSPSSADQESATDPGGPPEPREVGGKLGLLVALLRRPGGADISDMMAATGWQEHSVRGAIAGALKKKRGFPIISEKAEGPRRYRIAPNQALEPEQAVSIETPPAAASAKRGRRRG